MIPNTIMGAVYLSILDMILLIVFLTIIGWILRLFPIINIFAKVFKRK